MKAIPFTIAKWRQRQCLALLSFSSPPFYGLTKEMKDLYEENNKILRKEIDDDTKITFVFMDWKN